LNSGAQVVAEVSTSDIIAAIGKILLCETWG